MIRCRPGLEMHVLLLRPKDDPTHDPISTGAQARTRAWNQSDRSRLGARPGSRLVAQLGGGSRLVAQLGGGPRLVAQLGGGSRLVAQ
eukprot:CAMPEP_0115879600 /NCGR_PEP_ID=MMETSP0287-20121206/27411_1 /TAXON_ID=412157 /ORGANISM="Chrysochromulina rotalis, Strain UIO044" /LENGTH=86 /DNA_ID=CAMNT_0003335329 /DNA_START=153 /DNA_END=410 /DNA_ORIENTATION=-